LIEGLDAERFEVGMFHLDPRRDALSEQYAATAASFVNLPQRPRDVLDAIARFAPDVLVFLDIGMDPLSQVLACYRLAPVQLALWGRLLAPLQQASVSHGLVVAGGGRQLQQERLALGGSLLQAVHEVEGHRDHRGAEDGEPAEVFAPAHQVDLVAGGFLATLLQRDSIEVNSVHGQGVNQLAPGLRVEAHAPDGLIEAFVVADAPGFTLAVQWHPEWQTHLNPVSTQIFEAFGAACRLYRDR
jgi:hypothetical protein